METVEDDAGVIAGEAELEQADFESALEAQPTVRRARWLTAWIAGGVLSGGLIAIWGALVPDSEPALFAPVFAALFFVALTFVLGKVGPLSTASFAQRALRETGTKLSYRFDDEGAAFTTRGVSVELDWDAIPQVRETPRVFVMFLGDNDFRVLPKRALGRDEIERLHAWFPEPRPTGRALGGGLLKTVALWAALVFAFLCVWAFMDDAKRHHRDAPSEAP